MDDKGHTPGGHVGRPNSGPTDVDDDGEPAETTDRETPAIAASNLTKFYGRHRGIEDVTFEVYPGQVFGFLGPNGSGKSTTIRIMLDLLRPSKGSARLFGHSPRQAGPWLRQRVGYLPGDLALYPDMTAERLLGYFGSLRGLDSMRSINALAGRFKLDLSRKIGEYSTGNRQKVGIVQAFMHDPDLLILDEPTSGLDPLMQHQFYTLVEERRSRGRTVFLSSHLLPEVERIADQVGIIVDGRLQVVEQVQALKAKARRRLELHFLEPVPVAVFRRLFPVRSATANAESTIISLQVEGPIDDVVKAAAHYPMANIVSHDGDLEDVFLRYYRRPAWNRKRITVAPTGVERRRDDTMELKAIVRDDTPADDTVPGESAADGRDESDGSSQAPADGIDPFASVTIEPETASAQDDNEETR